MRIPLRIHVGLLVFRLCLMAWVMRHTLYKHPYTSYTLHICAQVLTQHPPPNKCRCLGTM